MKTTQFSYKLTLENFSFLTCSVQFEKFCLLVRISCPLAKDNDETPERWISYSQDRRSWLHVIIIMFIKLYATTCRRMSLFYVNFRCDIFKWPFVTSHMVVPDAAVCTSDRAEPCIGLSDHGSQRGSRILSYWFREKALLFGARLPTCHIRQ